MERNAILDLKALRESADGSPEIERHLLLRYIGSADRCLTRLQRLVGQAPQGEWRAELAELAVASLSIHATQLAALCFRAMECADEPTARMSVYFRIAEAYATLNEHIRKANLLTPPAIQGSS